MTDYVSHTDHTFSVDGDEPGIMEARILTTLFGRWSDDHPGETLIITREEFERYAEREIALGVGISMEQDNDRITVVYADRTAALRDIERKNTDRLASLIRSACEGIINDPDTLPQHREAAQHQLAALDALVPQRGPGEAVSDPSGVGEPPQDDPGVFARSARDDDERYDEDDPTANA